MDNFPSLNLLSQSLEGWPFEKKQELSRRLDFIARALDITPSQFEMARDRYEAIGLWLDAEDSLLKQYKPEIQPQGSFRLGTVIRPLSDADQFDVDLICLVQSYPHVVTQSKLKQLVGDRIKEKSIYKEMLEPEGDRCWTLNYSESTRFHMDILPAIPDPKKVLLRDQFAKFGILITDRKHPRYSNYSEDWPHSNPIGFANWFLERTGLTEKQITNQNGKIEAKVEPMRTQYLDRTPLQRAVQLLKRHRDIMFGDDEDKPISIIITTLLAYSYQGSGDVLETLAVFFSRVSALLEIRFDGIVKIPNPVDPKENFADKWEKEPRKKELFFQWLKQADTDFSGMILGNHPEIMKKAFGKATADSALNQYAKDFQEKRNAGSLNLSEKGTLTTEVGGTKIPNHTFYGDHN